MDTPRLPSSELIRLSMTELRRGNLSEDDYTTRLSVLEDAFERLQEALPEEVRAILTQVSPQAVEAYGLLMRWQVERGQYPPPREEGMDQEEAPATLAPTSQPITSQPNITQSPSGGFQVPVQPGQDPLNALYQATAGPLIAMHQLSQATHQPTASFQAGSKMALDTFQGAYKGLVTITEGRGKRATTTTETIAVIKDIYEAEQRQLVEQGDAQAVEDPAYWLPKMNMATVYFPSDEHGIEVAWILGDYDPQSSGIPAGMKPTPEQIAMYLHHADDEHWEDEVIKAHLRTPQQKAWLEQHDLTLRDILEGRTPINLSPQLVQVFFQDWNAKLGEHIYGY